MGYDHHLLMQTSIHSDDGDCEGGFPVIITDMLATGMPVLGSDHCDIPEIIKDKKNGTLAREGAIESTYEKLLEMLTDYNAYATHWIQFNHRFLLENFSAASCAKDRENLYENMHSF